MWLPTIRLIEMVKAHRAAATASLVYYRQARRAMLMEFPAHFVNRVTHGATRGHGPHDLLHVHFGSAQVIRRDVATDVTLGDHTGQRQRFCIRHHRRATAA